MQFPLLFLLPGQGFPDSLQFGVGDSPYLRGHFVNLSFHFCEFIFVFPFCHTVAAARKFRQPSVISIAVFE